MPSQECVIQMSIENVKKFGVNYLTDSNEETQYHYLSAHNKEANGYLQSSGRNHLDVFIRLIFQGGS